MKKNWKPILVACVLGVLYLSWGTQKSNAPDEKLAGHFDDLCQIAKKGIANPHSGVQRMFAYYGRNTPEMLKQFGALLVTIESISDDEAHDKRALQASRRMGKVLSRCDRTFEAFAMAIEGDAKASRLMEHGANRLSRTFEILFSGTREFDVFMPMLRLAAPSES